MKPGEKVGLELTQAERMLLLNAMHGLTEEIRDVMRATPATQPVKLRATTWTTSKGTSPPKRATRRTSSSGGGSTPSRRRSRGTSTAATTSRK